MAVAQLAEQLLPTTNAKGLNPINVTVLLHRKDEYLGKGLENAHLQKIFKMIDFSELFKRVIKYLVEGLMVAIAAYAIPKRSLNIEEIVLLALTAAATFSILDTYVPSIGVTTRAGAGAGIVLNMVGFPGGL